MKYLVPVALCLISASLCIFLGGCQTIATSDIMPASHFAFPNSNVKALGHVSAGVSKVSIYIPRQITAKDILIAMNNALAQQPGSDLLIDVKTDSKLRIINPLLYFPFYVTSYSIDGTAAKMEVGDQELKNIVDQVKYK